jgi:hypothetical protein
VSSHTKNAPPEPSGTAPPSLRRLSGVDDTTLAPRAPHCGTPVPFTCWAINESVIRKRSQVTIAPEVPSLATPIDCEPSPIALTPRSWPPAVHCATPAELSRCAFAPNASIQPTTAPPAPSAVIAPSIVPALPSST